MKVTGEDWITLYDPSGDKSYVSEGKEIRAGPYLYTYFKSDDQGNFTFEYQGLDLYAASELSPEIRNWLVQSDYSHNDQSGYNNFFMSAFNALELTGRFDLGPSL